MSSGYGTHSRVGRCYPVFMVRPRPSARARGPASACAHDTRNKNLTITHQEFKECLTTERDSSKCSEMREDYMECAPHAMLTRHRCARATVWPCAARGAQRNSSKKAGTLRPSRPLPRGCRSRGAAWRLRPAAALPPPTPVVLGCLSSPPCTQRLIPTNPQVHASQEGDRALQQDEHGAGEEAGGGRGSPGTGGRADRLGRHQGAVDDRVSRAGSLTVLWRTAHTVPIPRRWSSLTRSCSSSPHSHVSCGPAPAPPQAGITSAKRL